MPETAITAAEIRDQLRAVIEAIETTSPVDRDPFDPDYPDPAFIFEPTHYIQLGLYRRIDPHQAPAPGMRPLQAEVVGLIADFRLQLQRRGLNARDTKAFLPAAVVEGECGLWFKLGAWTFLLHAQPDPDPESVPGRWLLGILINADPDAITDEE